MNLQEIKAAVEAGKAVHWKNDGYKVVKANDQWLIVFTPNGHAIGLTWEDGITLNGDEGDFYTWRQE